jgi:NAD(P)-dependent dehydrogenase (short-subunit alcohol dehydrogenase family)
VRANGPHRTIWKETQPVPLLDGKIAIVTGAGHGIGRAHALELAKHGARVVVNDLGSSVRGEGAGKDADETVALIEKRGGKAVANYGDVSDHEQTGALIQQAIDTWGRLDVLVNNAGIVRDAAIWNMTVEDFDAVMRVHVRGTWSCCHHAAVHWRTRAKAGEKVVGRIINTTSGAGLTGNFGQSNYATAKAAIVGLTQTLALELEQYGVTANAIGPAGATRITATMPGAPAVVETNDVPDDAWEPMDPGNSSPLVAWLASDESGYLNGQVIRSIYDRIIWMHGWREAASAAAGEKRWDATQLGKIMTKDLLGTGVVALRFQ